jgi:hypothetical protein
MDTTLRFLSVHWWWFYLEQKTLMRCGYSQRLTSDGETSQSAARTRGSIPSNRRTLTPCCRKSKRAGLYLLLSSGRKVSLLPKIFRHVFCFYIATRVVTLQTVSILCSNKYYTALESYEPRDVPAQVPIVLTLGEAVFYHPSRPSKPQR